MPQIAEITATEPIQDIKETVESLVYEALTGSKLEIDEPEPLDIPPLLYQQTQNESLKLPEVNKVSKWVQALNKEKELKQDPKKSERMARLAHLFEDSDDDGDV